jgi:hypothetical protein
VLLPALLWYEADRVGEGVKDDVMLDLDDGPLLRCGAGGGPRRPHEQVGGGGGCPMAEVDRSSAEGSDVLAMTEVDVRSAGGDQKRRPEALAWPRAGWAPRAAEGAPRGAP